MAEDTPFAKDQPFGSDAGPQQAGSGDRRRDYRDVFHTKRGNAVTSLLFFALATACFGLGLYGYYMFDSIIPDWIVDNVRVIVCCVPGGALAGLFILIGLSSRTIRVRRRKRVHLEKK